MNQDQSSGRKFALLIAVSDCGAGFKPLHCPKNGVAELRELLINPKIGGFGPDQVTCLVNPNVSEMRSHVSAVFSNCSAQDLVLFYYTGHGVTDEFGNFFFTTSETCKFVNGALNRGTAVEAGFVLNEMGTCYSRRQVAILDSCFSGAFPDGMMAMDDQTVDVARQLGGEGRAVLTAATSTQYALEQEGEALSVYTRYLVEGLKTGAAVSEQDTVIRVGALHRYVQTKLKTAAAAMSPQIYAARDGQDIIIANAVIDNELRYRQLVQKYLRDDGRMSPTSRRIFGQRAKEWRITAELAQHIEAEVTQPYRERQANLKEFQDAYQEAIEFENPLTEHTIKELRDYQRMLNLRDEDIPEIANVLKQPAVTMSATVAAPPIAQLEQKTGPGGIPLQEVTLDQPTLRVDDEGNIIEQHQVQVTQFVEDLGGVPLVMVEIPGGEFWMGQTEDERQMLLAEVGQETYDKYFGRELPRHQVKVPCFFMGMFPVTQAQYEAVIGSNPSHFKGSDRPVENVSWNEAKTFCDRLSERTGRRYFLPTEAEWEYACRANMTTPFYFGNTLSTEIANYDGNYTYGNGTKGKYRKETTPAGQFPPNAFGLYDMHGNVWEWCADHYRETYDGVPTDGSPYLTNDDSAFRMLRGGSWLSDPWYCRSANRGRGNPVSRSNYCGFRVVVSSAWTPG
ncbi:MAG: SUMF1/EgtB/PvdO family nonheme iron enzyme [Synechococcales cyanobacterium K44_A2020_017]|nr:SUMF1/EgtB/PvdO family nonheme iron enzyme [Synechococcales cyanobacterium K32_A2020_035]MBF2095526.1 SUMF1/EgtB/PvdO family nonheme iron enzyme [Synechococcales cyanobacterium K44_A2020_017]